MLIYITIEIEWALGSLPLPSLSSCDFCLWENFSPRISSIREVRIAETKENSQRTPNNNNVLIEHSQGPLFSSLGP